MTTFGGVGITLTITARHPWLTIGTFRISLDFVLKMPPTSAPTRPPSPNTDSVTIRRVVTMAEYEECVAIERETWGIQFTEAVPTTILRIAQEVGGVTAAAFDPNGKMLGFVFGITGVRDGELAHWSDMLAVRVRARDLGLGKRLKAYQRELLIEIGVRTMYWTYDPLVARNAYLNLEQLGARVTEYRPNFYGEDTGSVMHAALGTDRFIVAWRLDEPHKPRVLDADWTKAPIISKTPPATLPDSERVRIAIPDDIFAVLDTDPKAAHAWRETTRTAFMTYRDRGYTVAGFSRANDADPATYLLTRTNEPSR
jgi:predicted GNAT superfamily acetyltransferase